MSSCTKVIGLGSGAPIVPIENFTPIVTGRYNAFTNKNYAPTTPGLVDHDITFEGVAIDGSNRYQLSPPGTPGFFGIEIIYASSISYVDYFTTKCNDGFYNAACQDVQITNCITLLADNAGFDCSAGSGYYRIIGCRHTLSPSSGSDAGSSVLFNAGDGSDTDNRSALSLTVTGNEFEGSIGISTLGAQDTLSGVNITGNIFRGSAACVGSGNISNLIFANNVIVYTPSSSTTNPMVFLPTSEGTPSNISITGNQFIGVNSPLTYPVYSDASDTLFSNNRVSGTYNYAGRFPNSATVINNNIDPPITSYFFGPFKSQFFDHVPATAPVLTYSRTGEPAQTAALRSALASLGLVVDNTTA